MTGRIVFVMAATLTLAAACERSSEAAAERMIEDALKAEGADADVEFTADGATISVQDEHGRTAVQAGQDLALPEAFPKDMPVFPDAKVTYTVHNETEGMATTFSAGEAAEKVYAFYVERLKQQGWSIDQEMKSGGLFILHATKDDRETAISISSDDAGSTIQIVVQDEG